VTNAWRNWTRGVNPGMNTCAEILIRIAPNVLLRKKSRLLYRASSGHAPV
jgi:hypothetical protein